MDSNFISGNCEICGIPTENLFLDSGLYKCASCCNPEILQQIEKSRKSSMKTPLKIDFKDRCEVQNGE